MSIRRNLRRFFPGYFIASLIGRLANILSVLLFAKSMSLTAFGTYAFLQSTMGVTLALGTLNLPTSIGVIIAQGGKEREALENSLLTGLSLILASGCAFGAVAVVILSAPSAITSATELLAFAALVAFTCLQNLIQASLFARGLPFLSSCCSAVAAIGLCLSALFLQPSTTADAVSIAFANTMVGVGCAAIVFFKRGFVRDGIILRGAALSFLQRRGFEIFRFSFLSLGSGFAVQGAIWFLQVKLISAAGPGANAPFALGNQFYNVVIFLPTIFGPILLRRMSREKDQGRRVREVVIATLCVAGISLSGVGLFSLVGGLIVTYLPVQYAGSLDVISWGVVAGAIMFAKFPLSVFFQSRLSGFPESVANILFALVLAGGAMLPFWNDSAVRSMQLRSLGHALQFIVLVAIFLFTLHKLKTLRAVSTLHA